MDEDDEFELRADQWEALKALRAPIAASSAGKHSVAIDDLVALGLATVDNQVPAMTPKGRKVLIRGSFRLWDARILVGHGFSP
jgi:hypothetical protein